MQVKQKRIKSKSGKRSIGDLSVKEWLEIYKSLETNKR